jgi:hypothetical protein
MDPLVHVSVYSKFYTMANPDHQKYGLHCLRSFMWKEAQIKIQHPATSSVERCSVLKDVLYWEWAYGALYPFLRWHHVTSLDHHFMKTDEKLLPAPKWRKASILLIVPVLPGLNLPNDSVSLCFGSPLT